MLHLLQIVVDEWDWTGGGGNFRFRRRPAECSRNFEEIVFGEWVREKWHRVSSFKRGVVGAVCDG